MRKHVFSRNSLRRNHAPSLRMSLPLVLVLAVLGRKLCRRTLPVLVGARAARTTTSPRTILAHRPAVRVPPASSPGLRTVQAVRRTDLRLQGQRPLVHRHTVLLPTVRRPATTAVAKVVRTVVATTRQATTGRLRTNRLTRRRRTTLRPRITRNPHHTGLRDTPCAARRTD